MLTEKVDGTPAHGDVGFGKSIRTIIAAQVSSDFWTSDYADEKQKAAFQFALRGHEEVSSLDFSWYHWQEFFEGSFWALIDSEISLFKYL